MFESYSRNGQNLYLLLMLLTAGFLQAQEKKRIPDIEKIYLHTDRSNYFIGEDLWYKAYNVNAYNNLLSGNSNVLYVELISPDSKIIARNKTNLEMGLGHGDFKLTDSVGVKPGIYQIRAYTNWNRNFGEEFVFKKNIEIIDVFNTYSNPDKIQVTPVEGKAPETDNQNTFKIDFFPEGGSLLENVGSVVGFKAVDNNGKPINVKGEIYDSGNELVTSFRSSHDGMGKFHMIPIQGKQYYAKVRTQSGTELRKELPQALKVGYLLSFRVLKGKNVITINTNKKTLSQNSTHELMVVCTAKGIPYLKHTQNVTKTTLSFELTKDKVPEGISQITLYDHNSRPQSERLVYFEKERDRDVQLTTDKDSYKPNEKALIHITSRSSLGETISGSFSLSVTDMNGLEEDKAYGTTISSHFLMESDIRGKVYNPGYYFNPSNPKRLEYLDNLLLIQGWRDFLWKIIPKRGDSLTYKAEQGFTISGRLEKENLFGRKPLVDSNVTLFLLNKKDSDIFSTTTDSLGGFKFENLMFPAKTTMFLNTRNEKGKISGKIVLDSIDQPPMEVSFKKGPLKLSKTSTSIVENVYNKFVAFEVKPENILDEVIITAKKESDAVVLYGVPDYSYVADEEAQKYTHIDDLIEEKARVATLITNLPLILIDGYPIADRGELNVLSPSQVVKIEAIRGDVGKMYYGEEASGGVISIFTDGSRGNRPKDNFHTLQKEIDGFYEARVFYAPNPEKTNKEELDNKASVRNTLYWNPYVHPNHTGKATVNYYNTAVETEVKVNLEGITANGIPVVKNIYYNIEK